MNIPFFKTAAITTCAGLVLVACGGGSGSDDNNNGSTLLEPLTITSENASQVSASGVGAADSVDNRDTTGGILGGIEMQSPETRFSLKTFAKQQLDQYRFSGLNTSETLAGVDIPHIETCTNGGSITMSGNVANLDSFLGNRGDSLTASFNNCREGSNTLNGSMSLTFNADENDESTAPYSNSMTITMNNLSIVSLGEATLQLHGDMTLGTSSNDGIIINLSMSGTNFSITEGGVTETLSNYQFDLTDNQATKEYSFNIKASIGINQLGGRVECTTPTLFEGVGESNPHTGVLKCVGANQSSVTLTAIDNTKVTLDIDTDGDGITDETQESTWAEVEL